MPKAKLLGFDGDPLKEIIQHILIYFYASSLDKSMKRMEDITSCWRSERSNLGEGKLLQDLLVDLPVYDGSIRQNLKADIGFAAFSAFFGGDNIVNELIQNFIISSVNQRAEFLAGLLEKIFDNTRRAQVDTGDLSYEVARAAKFLKTDGFVRQTYKTAFATGVIFLMFFNRRGDSIGAARQNTNIYNLMRQTKDIERGIRDLQKGMDRALEDAFVKYSDNEDIIKFIYYGLGAVHSPNARSLVSLQLLKALESKNAARMKFFQELGGDINYKKGNKPVWQIAMEREDEEMLTQIIAIGAGVNTPDSQGWFLIHRLVAAEKTEALRGLLEKSSVAVDVNAIVAPRDLFSLEGISYRMRKVAWPMMWILEHDTSPVGITPLSLAQHQQNDAIYKFILQQGANPAIRDPFGRSTTEYANLISAFENSEGNTHSTANAPHANPLDSSLATSVALREGIESWSVAQYIWNHMLLPLTPFNSNAHAMPALPKYLKLPVHFAATAYQMHYMPHYGGNAIISASLYTAGFGMRELCNEKIYSGLKSNYYKFSDHNKVSAWLEYAGANLLMTGAELLIYKCGGVDFKFKPLIATSLMVSTATWYNAFNAYPKSTAIVKSFGSFIREYGHYVVDVAVAIPLMQDMRWDAGKVAIVQEIATTMKAVVVTDLVGEMILDVVSHMVDLS